MGVQDDEYGDRPEGFWREFFLLRPERPTLRRMLDAIGPDDLEVTQTRQLFARAVAATKGSHAQQQQGGGGGADGHALEVSSSHPAASTSEMETMGERTTLTCVCGADSKHLLRRGPLEKVHECELRYHRGARGAG